MTEEHRRFATIMFTDMVGYSALTQKNESRALELLDEQRRLLRATFAKHAGREIEEELISSLSKIGGLEVIARTSIMQHKGKTRNIAEIGRELSVGTILEGSVRRDERMVRITAQLINVENQAHLWSQEYDRELKGVFAIQSDIAQRVAKALKVWLAASQRRPRR